MEWSRMRELLRRRGAVEYDGNSVERPYEEEMKRESQIQGGMGAETQLPRNMSAWISKNIRWILENDDPEMVWEFMTSSKLNQLSDHIGTLS